MRATFRWCAGIPVSLSRFSAAFCSFRRFLRFLIVRSACAFASSRSLLAFLFWFVRCADRIQSGRRHRRGVFSAARDFFLQCRDLFIERVFPPISSIRSHAHFAASPTAFMLFQSAQIVVYIPIHIHFFRIRGTQQFSRHQRHSSLLAQYPDLFKLGTAVEKCSVLSVLSPHSPDHPQAFKLADEDITDCPTFSWSRYGIPLPLPAGKRSATDHLCLQLTPAASCCVTPSGERLRHRIKLACGFPA
ncbi:hypothetical protein KCP76_24725 [Salmonella enterica subsp. enterica serovar Weltevreden]|nr:hypothetical protein KCP76_24725 [Salmonella enterica subsp. enterica serovar Weltevreden]